LIRALLVSGLALTVGCGSAHKPQLNVLSVEKAPSATSDMIVYVEVVNRAQRPMRLQRLQYEFASAGAETRRGEVLLGARLVEAGSAVVVEVPLHGLASADDADLPDRELGVLTLAGKLWAEQDEILRSFEVAAEVTPTK
jgi:hypothetical protein